MAAIRMRILHCILTHEFAGTERYLSELAAMQADMHEVVVLVARDTCDRRTKGDLVPRLPPSVRVVRSSFDGYLLSLLSLWRGFRPDVIHTHVGAASIRAGVLNSLGRTMRREAQARCPVVATLHRKYVARVYERHDGLICIADWQRAEIPTSFTGPVETISNWTPPCSSLPDASGRLRAELGIAEGVFLIGAAGRMIPEKGFDVLLEAFALGAPENARLVVFGDGPEREALQARACGHVLFPGFRYDLRRDLAGLDAFVMPSRHEPFGLVLLEAMAAGLPVLATNAGGVPDILGEHPSCMTPPGDARAMAEGIRALLGQPKKIWDMERFAPLRQAARIEAFYERCIDWKRRAQAGE
ncbi:glycosyltransferase [Acetobacter nitrogenifigens]|nr:glycosyltransferase [Acetobacter nitrogenifigens]